MYLIQKREIIVQKRGYLINSMFVIAILRRAVIEITSFSEQIKYCSQYYFIELIGSIHGFDYTRRLFS